MQQIEKYVEASMDSVLKMLKELCAIPAPSWHEEKRAEYCLNWFKSNGFDNAYIDEVNNVICEYNTKDSNDLTVFCAHLDTVFAEDTPLNYCEENGKIYCPAVSDDTASVCILLHSLKYLKENEILPENGYVIVCNTGEENVGNLKGTKALLKRYSGRVKRFISLDSQMDEIATRSVGSHRYEITATAPGGHSFLAFGVPNPLVEIAKMATKIDAIDIPKIGDSKTTYNVGVIEGGTGVTAIPQIAKMQCEYRSDNIDCLMIMKEKFDEIFVNTACDGVKIDVELLGDRPCAKGIDKNTILSLADECSEIIENFIDKEIKYVSSSTDCNYAHFLGIPAVALGVCYSEGEHTVDEFLYKDSLVPGFNIAINLLLRYI